MKQLRFLVFTALLAVALTLAACDVRRQDARSRPAPGATNTAFEAGPAGQPSLPKTVRTRDGRTFENVELFRAEPDGLLIVYYGPASKGIAKLAFMDLPDDIRRAFNYDSSRAEQFRQDRLAGAKSSATQQPAAPSVSAGPVAGFPAGTTPAASPERIELPTAAEVEAYDPELAEVIRTVEASKPAMPSLPIEMPPAIKEWYDAYCARVRAEADAKMASTMRHYRELTADDREPSGTTFVTNKQTGVPYAIPKLCIPTNNLGKP